MPFEDLLLLQKVLASILIGYLLGSVPFAHLAARLKGVDIFSTGNRRAGTANVFWNVSRKIGLLVLIGDVAKGSLSVTIAGLLGLNGPLLVLAGGASVLGHWKSVFTRFKGGDGMATLMGVTLTLTPVLALLGIAVGFATLVLSWRTNLRSAWGIASCFTALLALSILLQQQRDLVFSLAALAALVLCHNLFIHRRLAGVTTPADDLDLDLRLDSEEDPDSDLEHSTTRNRH
jgi:glycerol-3-phosphate acyltransferase PlsY